jgi:hypothetical protein
MYSDYYFSLGLTFLRIVVLDWDKNKFKINSVLYIYLHSKLGVHETPTVDMKGLLFLIIFKHLFAFARRRDGIFFQIDFT